MGSIKERPKWDSCTQLSHCGAQIDTPRPHKGKKTLQFIMGVGRWDGEHEKEAKMGMLLLEDPFWEPDMAFQVPWKGVKTLIFFNSF